MTNLLSFLSRLTEGQDESIRKVSGLLIISSLALVGVWSGCPNQPTPYLLVLSLVGYLASVTIGLGLYVYITLDMRRFVVRETPLDVWVLGEPLSEEDEEELSKQEESWKRSETIKASLILLQISSFLLSTLLLALALTLT